MTGRVPRQSILLGNTSKTIQYYLLFLFAMHAHEEWRILLACAWEEYARFCLRCQGCETQNNGTDKAHLDQATRCLEEALGVYLPGSEESLAATIVLSAVMLEKGQVDTASALLESARAQRLPEPEDGDDG